jgi:serine/threonine protein kinase
MGNPNIDNPIEMRLTDRTLNLTSLNIHRVLGKGQFGKVVLVSSKETGRKYALKVLNKSDIVSQGQVEHVRDEKDVLDRLDHPFCNKLVSAPTLCCPFVS